jgi:phage baseplate assembly protein W
MVGNLYRGFSTLDNRGLDTAVYDRMLVNRDLMNLFNTPIGSRPGRRRFGSIIPTLAFELGDPRTQSLIEADIRRNISSDPRVKLVSLKVSVDLDQHTVYADLLLDYVELDTQDWANIPIRLTR